MAELEEVNFTHSQRPSPAEWESLFNTIIVAVNSLLALGLSLNPAGKLDTDITGDAATVGGMTVEEIVAGEFPYLLKTLADLLVSDNGLVLQGGVATKNAGTANRLDVTACTVLQKVAATGYMDRVELDATYKTTSLPNEVYYLDVEPAAGDFTWDTSHPEGDYVAIAQAHTDVSANIQTVIDVRPLTGTPFAGLAAALTAMPTDGSVTTAKLADEAVTLAKLANIATATLLGRTSEGDGVPEELDAEQVRELLECLPLTGGTLTGTLNLNTTNGRIVLPVGTDKWAT